MLAWRGKAWDDLLTALRGASFRDPFAFVEADGWPGPG